MLELERIRSSPCTPPISVMKGRRGDCIKSNCWLNYCSNHHALRLYVVLQMTLDGHFHIWWWPVIDIFVFFLTFLTNLKRTYSVESTFKTFQGAIFWSSGSPSTVCLKAFNYDMSHAKTWYPSSLYIASSRQDEQLFQNHSEILCIEPPQSI